jgi:hypothetical protein
MVDRKSVFYGYDGSLRIHQGRKEAFGSVFGVKLAILFSSYVGTDTSIPA